MRTFAVGDIHGSHRALLQVLERSGFNREEDRLITLGDICDGWPETKKCIYERC
jgi:serine/threonine protein phosphatase 1